MAMGAKAFESPLISHERMRAMYRALVEVRGLAGHAKLKENSHRGVEACWVGTAIDLKEGDLTIDTGAFNESALLAHIRAIGQRAGAAAVKATEIKRVLGQMRETPCEVFPGSAYERLLCAAGAAMALQASGGESVLLAYARLGEISGAEWKQLLTVMGQKGLPLILLVMPGESRVDLEATAVKAAGSRELAIPVIPVDAGDAVAIYRVTQETMVRARAGGGAALIVGGTCGTDAVKLLGTQLLRKGICTERWVGSVGTHLKSLLASF